jgi:hypothetical protein
MIVSRQNLCLALALALTLVDIGGARAQGDVWVARRLPWYGLPNRELIGSAPTAAIEIPAKTDACGALSDRLDPFGARGPVVLKVTLRVVSGAVAISVRDEAGMAVLSRERTLQSRDGEPTVYIALQPGDGPRVIALCNAGGDSGSVEVLSLQAARADALPADDMARVNLGML